MKKQKICFDTSTICSLFDGESENTKPVTALFESFKKSKIFDLTASPIFFNEVAQAPKQIIEKISEIVVKFNIKKLPDSINAIHLAEFYVTRKILTGKHFNDLAHIAYASIFSCDYFISCDTNDIVREQTIKLVQKTNSGQNIFVPKILTPLNFMEIQNGKKNKSTKDFSKNS